MPGTMFPIAVMPIMASVGVVPGIMGVRFVVIPPVVRVEAQTDAGEMHSGIGMPTVAKAIAGNIGGSAAGGAGQAGDRDRGGQESLFDGFTVNDFTPSFNGREAS